MDNHSQITAIKKYLDVYRSPQFNSILEEQFEVWIKPNLFKSIALLVWLDLIIGLGYIKIAPLKNLVFTAKEYKNTQKNKNDPKKHDMTSEYSKMPPKNWQIS